MNKELKKAIVLHIIDNEKDFQLVNNTTKEFREYIYNSKGELLIGGGQVREFIVDAAKLLTF